MPEKYPYTSCGGRYKIPQDVKKAAKLGLDMHKKGFQGGTKTGWDRARQLIKCQYVTKKTVQTMKAWFARHTHTSYPGYKKWVQQGKPTKLENNKSKYRGAVAWLIWGGEPAKKWLKSIKLD